MDTLGNLLKQERMRRGLSLAEVEQATNIRSQYLEALEEEDFQAIPGKVYAQGFLRNYARYLGIPPEPLNEELKQRWSGEIPPVQEIVETTDYSGQPKNRSMRLLGYLVSAAAVIALIYVGMNFSGASKPPEQSSNLTNNQSAQPVQPTQPTQPAPTEVQPPSPTPQVEGVKVILRIKDRDCWLRCLEDGQKKVEGIFKPGDTIELQGKEKVFVHVGDSGAVEAEVNGQSLGVLGEKGKPLQKEFTR